jgi:hypothetical protein
MVPSFVFEKWLFDSSLVYLDGWVGISQESFLRGVLKDRIGRRHFAVRFRCRHLRMSLFYVDITLQSL